MQSILIDSRLVLRKTKATFVLVNEENQLIYQKIRSQIGSSKHKTAGVITFDSSKSILIAHIYYPPASEASERSELA